MLYIWSLKKVLAVEQLPSDRGSRWFHERNVLGQNFQLTEDVIGGLDPRQNVAMFDKILQGTLDTTNFFVFSQEVYCVKIVQPCYNLARDPCYKLTILLT